MIPYIYHCPVDHVAGRMMLLVVFLQLKVPNFSTKAFRLMMLKTSYSNSQPTKGGLLGKSKSNSGSSSLKPFINFLRLTFEHGQKRAYMNAAGNVLKFISLLIRSYTNQSINSKNTIEEDPYYEVSLLYPI